MANRNYKKSTLNKLFAFSNNKCSFPYCDVDFFSNETDDNISNIAHIEGLNPGSERYNPSSNDDYRNSCDNLILLCPTHHVVTNNEKIYTVDVLKKMKYEHENKLTSFNNYFDKKKYDFNHEIQWEENRKEDLKKIDLKNNDINGIYALPKTGKTILKDLWINNNYDDYKIKEIDCETINFKKEENIYKSALFFEKLKISSKKHILVFENFENILNKQNKIENSELKEFFINYFKIKPKNLKIILCSWYAVDFELDLNIKEIQLKSYNVDSLKGKFQDLGITEENFEKLKDKYQGHSLLIENALRLIKTKKSTIDDLFNETKDNLEVLKDEIEEIFSNVKRKLRQVLFEILVDEGISDTISSKDLNQLTEYSLIDNEGENKYKIHRFIVSIGQKYFRKNKDFISICCTKIERILDLIDEREESDNDKNFDKNVLDFQKAFEAFKLCVLIKKDPKDFPLLENIFIKNIEQNPLIINTLFGKDSSVNIERIDLLKDILGKEFNYYKSVQYRLQENTDDALKFLKKYKAEIDLDNDSKSSYNYYCQLGAINKLLNENYEAVSNFKNAINNRAFIELKTLKNDNPKIQKIKVKTFLTPVIEISNLYIALGFIEEALNLINKEYAIIESFDLSPSNAIYNVLGKMYLKKNDDENAIINYTKAYQIKQREYQTLFNLGSLYFKKKDYETALKYFEYGLVENVFKPNFYVYSRYAVCKREIEKDYIISHSFLTKALNLIEIDNLSKPKNKTFVQSEIIITYLKELKFEEAKKLDYIKDKDVLLEISKKPINNLLNNLDYKEKIELIDWFIIGNELFKNLNFKNFKDELFYKKIAILTDNNEYSTLKTILKLEIERKIVYFNDLKFSEVQKNKLAECFCLFFTEKLSFKVHYNCLLLFATFTSDHSLLYEKLKDYFSKNILCRENYALFVYFKNCSIREKKGEFINFIESSSIKTFFDKHSYEIANFCLSIDDIINADKYYNIALSHFDDFQTHLEYSIFMIKNCKLEEFKEHYHICLEKFKNERDSNEKTAMKLTKTLINASIKSAHFKIFTDNIKSFDDFITKEKENLNFIKETFSLNFKIIVLENLTEKSKDLNLKNLLAIEYFKEAKFFLAVKELSFILSKNESYIYLPKINQILESKKEINEINNMSDTIEKGQKLFEIGDYENAFTQFINLKNIKNHSFSENELDKLIYCSIKCDKEIDYKSFINSKLLLNLGQKFKLQKKIDLSLDCLILCSKLTEVDDFVIESNYEIANYYYKNNSPKETREYIEKIENLCPEIHEKHYAVDLIILKSKLLCNERKHKKAFSIINSLLEKRSSNKQLITEKETIYKNLKFDLQKRYEYEYLFTQAQKSKLENTSAYEENLYQSFKKNPLNQYILNEIIASLKNKNERFILSDKERFLKIFRHHYVSNNNDFNLNRNLGNIFKENNDYWWSEFFYGKMEELCENFKDVFIYHNNLAILYLLKYKNKEEITIEEIETNINYAENAANNCTDNRAKFLNYVRSNWLELNEIKSQMVTN